jgi:hypothetical protein
LAIAFTFFTYRQEPLLLRTIRQRSLPATACLSKAGLDAASKAGAETVPSNIQFATSRTFAQPRKKADSQQPTADSKEGE